MPKPNDAGPKAPKPGMSNGEALATLHRILNTITALDQKLDVFAIKEKKDMPLDPTVTAVIAQIDAATNAIAARIQRFIDAANTSGSMTAAEIVAALQPEADRLTAMGADPDNPVPVVA